MITETISLEVDDDTARDFLETSTEDRRKLQLLLSLRLRELTVSPPRPLQVVMGEIGQQAISRGLTPEILENLLGDERDSNCS